jgi:hypothetical protein
MDDLFWEAAVPLLQEGEVVFPASEVVRKHHRNLLDHGKIAATLRAEQDAVDNHLSIYVEFKQFEWIMLVDWARKYVEELPLHAAQTPYLSYKTLGEPKTLIYCTQSLSTQPAIARGSYPDSFRPWK